LSATNVEDIATSEEFNVLATLLRAGIRDGVIRKAPKMGTPLSKYRPPGMTNNNASNGLQEKLAQVAFRMTPRAADAISILTKALSKPRDAFVKLKVVKSSKKSPPSVALVNDTKEVITKGIDTLLKSDKIEENIKEAFEKKQKAYQLQKKINQLRPLTNTEKEDMHDALSDAQFIFEYGKQYREFKDLVPSSNEEIALFFESGGGGQTDKPPPGWKQTRVSTRGGRSFLAYSKGGVFPQHKNKKIRTISALHTYLKQELKTSEEKLTDAEKQWLHRYRRIQRLRSKGIVLRNTPLSSEDATKVAVRAQNTRSLTSIMNEKRAQFNNKTTRSQPGQVAPDPQFWRAFFIDGQLRYLPRSNNSSSIGENYMTNAEVLAVITHKGKLASEKEKQWKQNVEARLAAEANEQRFRPISESFAQSMKRMNDPKKLARSKRSVSMNTNSRGSTSSIDSPHDVTVKSRTDNQTSRTTNTSRSQNALSLSLPDPSLSLTNLIERRIPKTPNTWELFRVGAKKRYRRKSNGQIATIAGKSDKAITNPKGLAEMLKKSGTDSEKKWAGRFLKMEELKDANKASREQPNQNESQGPIDLSLSVTNLIEGRIPNTPKTWKLLENDGKARYKHVNTKRTAVMTGGRVIRNPKTLAVMLKKSGTNEEKKWAARYLKMIELRNAENEFTNYASKIRKFGMEEPEKEAEPKKQKGRKVSEPNKSKSMTPQERFKMEMLKQRVNKQKTQTPWVGYGKNSLDAPVQSEITMNELRALEELEKKQRKKVVAGVRQRQSMDKRSLTKLLEQAFVPYGQVKVAASIPNRSKQPFERKKNNNTESFNKENISARSAMVDPKVVPDRKMRNSNSPKLWKTRKSLPPTTAFPRKVVVYPKGKQSLGSASRVPLVNQSPTQLEKYKKRIDKMTKALDKAMEKKNQKKAYEWVMEYKKSNAPNVKYMANALTNKNMNAWRNMYLKTPIPNIANKVAKVEALAAREAIERQLKKNAKAENNKLTKAKTTTIKTVAPNGTVANTAPKRAPRQKTIAANTPIVVQQVNPKRPGSDSWQRYERYKNAMTYGQLMALGATKDDFRHNMKKGFLTLG
jgi:hypothetical protein